MGLVNCRRDIIDYINRKNKIEKEIERISIGQISHQVWKNLDFLNQN